MDMQSQYSSTITAIKIENFKSIEGPARIELRDLVLLFGPNSSGKSAIVDAVMLARKLCLWDLPQPAGVKHPWRSANFSDNKNLITRCWRTEGVPTRPWCVVKAS